MTEARQSQTGFADVNGAGIYYEIAGSGHPLVLVHAGIADSRMWDDQFDLFAQHYRVLRYDVRGFGNSSMPSGPYSYSEDLYGLLRFLEIERAHLLGVSLGGKAVIELALSHPELVSALIPVAPGVPGYEYGAELEQRVNQALTASYEGDIARAVELTLQIWVDGPNRAPDQVDPMMRERARIMIMNNFTLQSQYEGEEQVLQPPAIERLHEIHAPTLVVVGDGDVPDMLRVAELLEQRIPGARKAVMHGVAHLPNMDRPREFNQIVLDFLDSL